jgi:formylglycine-generating enzyme required for sulfatase activity
MTWVRNSARFLLVTIGIIMLTSLGIDASEYLTGSQSALGILADRATEGTCPEGMTFIEYGTNDFCIDTYEASPGVGCVVEVPAHDRDSARNIRTRECISVAVPETMPWVHVTYHQAREVCAKSGKRLPSNAEWYQAALGTTEASCNTDSVSAGVTGESECQSGAQVHDMIGNVWEWVDAGVEGGSYEERQLPETGYVQNADMNGVALATGTTSSESFHNDYFWSEPSGVRAMMRGGFYSSGGDAGLYSVHAAVEPNFSSPATGFRCVRDI